MAIAVAAHKMVSSDALVATSMTMMAVWADILVCECQGHALYLVTTQAVAPGL